MMSTPPPPDKQAGIVLAPSLSSDQAAGLLALLRATQDRTVMLDASGVERIGGLCLQVLLSAARSLADAGRELRLSQPSDACIAALSLLGAQDLLLSGDPA